MPTIKDVAKASGVSVATVSNYINGKSVRKNNEAAIEYAINSLNYKVDMLARSFRTKQTFTIGVVVNTFYSLFYMEVLHEMEKHLRKNGYCMIVFSSDNDCENEKQILDIMLNKYVDAIIVFPVSYEKSQIESIVHDEVPVVLVDHIIKNSNYPCVVADNINASYSVVEYMIKNGHKNIAVVSGHRDASTTNERILGYLRAFEDYHLPVDDSDIFIGDYTSESGYDLTQRVLASPKKYTALFVLSFDLFLGVAMALKEKNIKIPDDLSLVSFDYSEYIDLSEKMVTVVKQPNKLLGVEAAKKAIELIMNRHESSSNIVRCKCEVMIRDSVKNIL
jgi:Transcriptional regulators